MRINKHDSNNTTYAPISDQHSTLNTLTYFPIYVPSFCKKDLTSNFYGMNKPCQLKVGIHKGKPFENG